MSLQKVFTQAYTEELRTHIDPANYQGEEFAYDESQVKTLMRVRHPEHLADFMVEHADNDFDCAIALYEAYKDISPVFAQEDRLWVYLSHVELYAYIKKRWPLPQDETKQPNHIRDHWFRGIYSNMRSALSGLWWAVRGTIIEDAEDPYALTKILFSNYSFRTTFFGATELFRYKEAAIGILQFIKENPEIMTNNMENRVRYISRYFNQLGGVKQLTSLSSYDFLNECYKRKDDILNATKREDVQNQNILANARS